MLLSVQKQEGGTVAVSAPQLYRAVIPATFASEHEAKQWLTQQNALRMVDQRSPSDTVSGTYDVTVKLSPVQSLASQE